VIKVAVAGAAGARGTVCPITTSGSPAAARPPACATTAGAEARWATPTTKALVAPTITAMREVMTSTLRENIWGDSG